MIMTRNVKIAYQISLACRIGTKRVYMLEERSGGRGLGGGGVGGRGRVRQTNIDGEEKEMQHKKTTGE